MLQTRNVFAALLTVGLFVAAPSITRGADDAAKPASPPPAKAAAHPPGVVLDRFEHLVNELKLTEEQKPKLAALMDKAHQDTKDIASDRDPKFTDIFKKLRKDVAGVLTAAQQLELRDKIQPGPGARIDEIKRQLHRPEFKLTEEQKTKVDAVLDDAKKKLEDLRADAQKGGKNINERAAVIVKDMHDRLAMILSEEQQKQINSGSTQTPPAGAKSNTPEKK